ncbi:MAG: permease [Pseudomonadota bacterium]
MTMADVSARLNPRRWRLERAWYASLAILFAVAVLRPGDLASVSGFAAGALANTAIFVAFAVASVAYLKASGAEAVVARAFQGAPVRMVVLASLMGGLAPFCSCEVIPFVAALLAMGVPLAAVMAFWLSSPMMDPPMFFITASALGFDFAVAKTVAAVAFGLFGGAVVMLLARTTGVVADPLRQDAPVGGCGCRKTPFSGQPVWRFWSEEERRSVFRTTAAENAVFLLKWLTLAYLVEALMVHYIPAETIGSTLGGDGLGTIALGAVIGGPAYLNGYAAAPLVGGLLDQGMAPGTAMSFMLAGSVSSIPAAIAVWALVKPRVFAVYLGLGITASMIAGVIWAILT